MLSKAKVLWIRNMQYSRMLMHCWLVILFTTVDRCYCSLLLAGVTVHYCWLVLLFTTAGW